MKDEEDAMQIGPRTEAEARAWGKPVELSAEESATLRELIRPDRKPTITPRMREAARNYKRVMGEMLPEPVTSSVSAPPR